MYILSKEERYLLTLALSEFAELEKMRAEHSKNIPELHKHSANKVESLLKRISMDKTRIALTKVK